MKHEVKLNICKCGHQEAPNIVVQCDGMAFVGCHHCDNETDWSNSIMEAINAWNKEQTNDH